MNQLRIAIDENRDEANLFGIQLEAPLPNDAGKSLHHKIWGMVLDAAKQLTYSAG